MLSKIRSLYVPVRFFKILGGVIFMMAAGFGFPILFIAGQTMLMIMLLLFITDAVILYSASPGIACKRIISHVFSLGDDNEVKLLLANKSGLQMYLTIIDELPFQFQKRDFGLVTEIEARGRKQSLTYLLNPKSRGIYEFGNIQLFLKTKIGLAEVRKTIKHKEQIAVYPSLIQMKKFELRSIESISRQYGIKRIRKIGHSYEFEQIKNYVRGDDYRSINWKATGRRGDLMVNQYEDEKSQQVFCILDNSRVMKMPFNGLSLFDYAVNTSLVISNITLKKHDKIGLISFSNKLDTFIKPSKGNKQMRSLLISLYNQKEKMFEASYELLYQSIHTHINNRSLLLLFTNFENTFMLDRVLNILRKINKLHLLVVIFFENAEIADHARIPAKNTEDIYYKVTAEKFLSDKQQMVNQLKQVGIQVINTRPENLSINTINKYLELKSRGMI